jgi:hypothetical protein
MQIYIFYLIKYLIKYCLFSNYTIYCILSLCSVLTNVIFKNIVYNTINLIIIYYNVIYI